MNMRIRFTKKFALILLASLAIASPFSQRSAQAGAIIIDGTDANDHGSASATTNFNGWEYMQRVLENLGAQRLAGNPGAPKTVFNIGADTGSQSGLAIASAFGKSSLASSGWSITNIIGGPAISAFLGSLNVNSHGILAFTTAGNSGGDLDAAELAAMTANATNIDSFLLAGGAMHAMGQSGPGANGYLAALLPGLVVTDVGGGGFSSDITITAAGTAAFPGLTNADLAGADPWHNYYSGNFGALSVLATAVQGVNTRALILGGNTGSITTPNPTVPEPSSLVVFGLGALGLVARQCRKQRTAV